MKTVSPKQSFQSPRAYLTAVVGDVDCAAQRLTEIQQKALAMLPVVEENLPIVFNEYCTTWGNPSEENLHRITESIKNKGITYFVIDCGWYKNEHTNWYNSMGDWVLNAKAFPNGLKPVTEHIRQAGMIPGIWFEMEVCGAEATAFNLTEHLLTRDGFPITVGSRRFWDFRDSYVIDYLKEKVITFIKTYNFGYLKVDYNDSLGIGTDGAESLGEGLRLQLEAVQSFFKLISEEVPDIVIENCASGGHRIEPSMLAITSMSSFSDAHESLEIPILAANLHRVMLPRQCQIWAVLRKDASIQSIVYSLSSTMLGRMCLSGDVIDLSLEQWNVVKQGVSFYKQVSHLIKNGSTRKYGHEVSNYVKPKGWQAIVRASHDYSQYLIVIHQFEKIEEDIVIHLPEGTHYSIANSFMEGHTEVQLDQHILTVKLKAAYSAACFLLST